jgi:CheY-like chemotaxis protein
LGLKVFLAEDEALVSVMLETMLAEFGCIVTGVGASVAQALSQVETIHVIDVAILDVHLGGETVFPVADVLRQRHVPFVFSTGFGPADLAERYPDSPLLNKPYGPDALADVLAGFRGSAA